MGVVLRYSIFFMLYMHSLRICFGCLDGNCRVLAFPSYFLIADKCLEGHTILIVQDVPDMGLCELLCYNKPNCVSVNYEIQRQRRCELNNSTHRAHDGDFKQREGCLYHGAISACDTPRCQNNGTCQSGFTGKKYRCLCPFGFTGEQCEHDSSTTSPAPRTSPETTNPPSTTEESSTLPPTTTFEPVTLSPPTTTSKPTTSPPPTTTSKPITSPPPTTTSKPITSPTTTTTSEPATSQLHTTTSEPTTTPVPTTKSEPTCTIPGDTARLEDVLGFGFDLNSHALYNITENQVLLNTELKFRFRASNPNGIMLYTANEPSQSNFIECHLEESKVNCSFSAEGHILKFSTPNASYSDGKWHTVRLSKREVGGTLYVDGTKVDSIELESQLSNTDPLERLFLGGVPKDFVAKLVPAHSNISFPGCITNLTVNDKNIDTSRSLFKTQNCYRDSPESGVSFKNEGGYLKVADEYQVGKEQEISLEIKPTTHTGLLLSSWSAKGTDYIVLEMSSGNIIFRAQNGGGELVAKHIVHNPLHFCDGEWHKIQVSKIKDTVEIQVDGNPVIKDGPRGFWTRVDISDALYVGGLPAGEAAKGVTVEEGYTGCVRNLVSREPNVKPQPLYLANPLMMVGNLYLGGCPHNL